MTISSSIYKAGHATGNALSSTFNAVVVKPVVATIGWVTGQKALEDRGLDRDITTFGTTLSLVGGAMMATFGPAFALVTLGLTPLGIAFAIAAEIAAVVPARLQAAYIIGKNDLIKP